ncbi:MAG TPA: aldo/keto reductase [Gaiellaceae bacterium]|nr:aldo/keto reductase [Gaiellaceae bacterium]
MRTRTLGTSGPDVSVVGLGCNNFGSRVNEEGTRAVVDAALDAGITLFDTADVYGNRGGSETALGKALKGRRDRVVLATKFGHAMTDDAPPNRGSREYVREAVEASLERLQTDWIDLYQYHRPDGITPIEETLGALNELVDEGKVRFIGSSNLDGRQVVEADDVAKDRGWARFVSAQNEYSFLQRGAEEELLPTAERLGIGVLPYFPLASGLLTGKYRRGLPAPAGTRLALRPERLTDDAFDRIEALESFAGTRGISLLDVAIGGLAAQPAIASVIAGATKPEQARANAAAGDWVPMDGDLRALRDVLDG